MAGKASSGKSTSSKSRAAKVKKPPAKPTAKKSASPINTSDLKTKLSRLEGRLTRNSNQTKKVVAELEARFAALESLTKKSSTSQKASLTRQVNQLKGKLTEITDDVRRDVESDLKSALTNPSELTDAISSANARLDQANAAQADAMRKVNLHLAQMAKAVEARFETQEARLSNQETRLSKIEHETAAALTATGDKIETLLNELNKRRKADQLVISEKVNELALETQAEFEAYKQNLSVHMEQLGDQPDVDGKIDRLAYQIDRLNARLDSLEHDMTNVSEAQEELYQSQMSAPDAYQSSVPSMEPVPAPQPMPVPVSAPVPVPVAVGAAQPSNVVAMPDAFAPAREPEPIANREPHMPVEFDPTAFDPAPEPAPVSLAQDIPPPMAPPPPPSSPAMMPSMPPGPVTMNTPPPASASEYPPSEDPLPFADPAYAENNDMRAQRITGSDEKTNIIDRLRGLPLTGRNLRVAGMAVGICVVGLWAGKTVLGVGGKTPQPNVPMAEAPKGNELAAIEGPARVATPDIETVPAIGDYEDNKSPIKPGSAPTSLMAAADSGNPIAQFQLGLSKLQQNNTSEGVKLIRLAANKNLPAAQYRLAKLYEAGQGVEADPVMARKLTEQAAKAGNRIAMHDLALYHADGRGGVEKDITTAVSWFMQAAERGVVDSQFNLAVLSESGQGTQQNAEAAYFWYSIAARQGDQFAQKRVAALESTLAPEQLQALKTQITSFKPKPIDEAANGIFKDVPWAASGKSAQVTNIRKAQTYLTELGYDIGGADGTMGPRTKAAIIKFERANGLSETGQVSEDLLQRLELAADV